MPAQYEAMRDHFIREGMKEKLAKKKAARIYNSKHHSNPVTRSSVSSDSSGHHTHIGRPSRTDQENYD